jgi:hypothetical protein
MSLALPTLTVSQETEQAPKAATGPNLLVFRDDRRQVSGPKL